MSDVETGPDGEGRPLAGLRVVVTRPAGQAGPFARRLEELGARPLVFPTIRIVPPEDPAPLREAAREIAGYRWVAFTSVNGVDRLAEALEREGCDGRSVEGRVAAIGPATAERARERLGVAVDVVPEEYRAEALARSIRRSAAGRSGRERTARAGSGGELEGRRVLLPRASGARPVLPDRLEAAGASVDEVAAYRTVEPGPEELAPVRDRLRANEVDWLTFTASSTVRSFVSSVGTDVGGARVAAIGPITAGTARERGLPVHVVADRYTIPGLLEALLRAAGREARETA